MIITNLTQTYDFEGFEVVTYKEPGGALTVAVNIHGICVHRHSVSRDDLPTLLDAYPASDSRDKWMVDRDESKTRSFSFGRCLGRGSVFREDRDEQD